MDSKKLEPASYSTTLNFSGFQNYMAPNTATAAAGRTPPTAGLLRGSRYVFEHATGAATAVSCE